MLFSEVTEICLAQKACQAGSVYGTHRSHANKFERLWGDRPVDEITRHDVEGWKMGRIHAGAAPATVHYELSFLNAVFETARDEGLITKNPTRRVKRPRIQNARVRHLLPDEEGRLKPCLRPEHWLLVLFAMLTGMRRLEVFSLRFRDLDMASGWLLVRTSKTGKPRNIPIGKTVREILLRRLEERRPKEEFVWNYRGRTGFKAGVEFARDAFAKALKKAEISDFCFRDLRHTFATRLLLAGASVPSVKDLLGHTSIQMTMRYMHLTAEHLRDAVHLLDHLDQADTPPRPELLRPELEETISRTVEMAEQARRTARLTGMRA